jgi:hypothetical protein
VICNDCIAQLVNRVAALEATVIMMHTNMTGVPASAWLIGENTIKVKARKGAQESEATPLAVTVKKGLAAPSGVRSKK